MERAPMIFRSYTLQISLFAISSLYFPIQLVFFSCELLYMKFHPPSLICNHYLPPEGAFTIIQHDLKYLWHYWQTWKTDGNLSKIFCCVGGSTCTIRERKHFATLLLVGLFFFLFHRLTPPTRLPPLLMLPDSFEFFPF